MTDKDKEFEDIKQFKRDLSSYKNYKSKIKILNDKLLELDTRLENVKSPKFDVVQTHTKSTNGDIRLELIEEKIKIQNRLDVFRCVVDEIDEKLGKLTKEESDILKLIYIEHVPINKIAKVYYKSDATMYRNINDIIMKVI